MSFCDRLLSLSTMSSRFIQLTQSFNLNAALIDFLASMLGPWCFLEAVDEGTISCYNRLLRATFVSLLSRESQITRLSQFTQYIVACMERDSLNMITVPSISACPGRLSFSLFQQWQEIPNTLWLVWLSGLCTGWCGSVDWVLACELKGH